MERINGVKASLDDLDSKRINKRDIQAAMGSFTPIWEQLFPQERARIVRLLIQEVTYNADTGEIEIMFRPSGIKALAAENEEEAA